MYFYLYLYLYHSFYCVSGVVGGGGGGGRLECSEVVKMAPRELGNTKSVIGRGPDNDDNDDNDNPRRIRGVRKEENQQ